MGWFKDKWNDLTGKTAAREASAAATAGADANIAFQQQGLDYLKETNAPLLAMRDKAMGQMGGLLGLSGYDQAGAMSALKNNPMYKAQIGNIDQQLANAQSSMAAQSAATGGLRGGNYQRGLAETSFDADRAKQDALSNAYAQQMGGLGGLAGLNTGTDQIAGQMSNMGNIAGQGIIGASQSAQAAKQAGMGNLMGLGQLGLGAAGLFFSDERLKKSIIKIGDKNGLPWYSWEWNEKANEFGEHGYSEGHMAGEVEAKYPNAVIVDAETGYKKVNYGALNNG